MGCPPSAEGCHPPGVWCYPQTRVRARILGHGSVRARPVRIAEYGALASDTSTRPSAALRTLRRTSLAVGDQRGLHRRLYRTRAGAPRETSGSIATRWARRRAGHAAFGSLDVAVELLSGRDPRRVRLRWGQWRLASRAAKGWSAGAAVNLRRFPVRDDRCLVAYRRQRSPAVIVPVRACWYGQPSRAKVDTLRTRASWSPAAMAAARATMAVAIGLSRAA
jgi:hypothetical protein